ncbi:MAG: rod-binding protein [Lachnospiraceae bacterium]|nr:rod-binding protein [Lachnospiraceae bacterium]
MDMSVNAVDYASVYNQTQTTGLENRLKNSDSDKITDKKAMEACKEFEAYMLEQVYKSMEKTIMRAEEKSDYEDYFGDMLTQQYVGSIMDQGGIGLARQLYDSMQKNNQINITSE